jgi:hypothetical protein
MQSLFLLAYLSPWTFGQNTTITTATNGDTRFDFFRFPSNAPDVRLDVPNLSVGRIELDVDDLDADINLNTNVAGLVSINAGIKGINLGSQPHDR